MLALSLEGFRRRHLFLNPDRPPACVFLWSSPVLCGLRATAFSSFSRFTLSLLCKKNSKISSSFSYSFAPFKKLCFDKPVYINSLRTLSQSTRGGIPSPKVFSHFFPILVTRHCSLATIPFRITFFADPHPLTPIESHSYKKHRGGGYRCQLVFRVPQTCLQHPSVTLTGVPFWERACGNAGVTRVKTLGR